MKYRVGGTQVTPALLNLQCNSIYQVTAIKGCPLGCSGRGELDSCLSDSEPYIIQTSPYHSHTHFRTLINVSDKSGLNPARCITHTHTHTCRRTQIHCVLDAHCASHHWACLVSLPVSFLLTCRDVSDVFFFFFTVSLFQISAITVPFLPGET